MRVEFAPILIDAVMSGCLCPLQAMASAEIILCLSAAAMIGCHEEW
jgi:hypothetical protein